MSESVIKNSPVIHMHTQVQHAAWEHTFGTHKSLMIILAMQE